MRTGAELDRLCELASITVAMVRDPDFDPADYGPNTRKDMVNMYRILADAFVELQARHRSKPAFRIPAHKEAAMQRLDDLGPEWESAD